MATDVFYDRRRQWTRMLRMGLKQAQGGMKRHNGSGVIGYCCLGVGCELAVIHGLIPPAVRKYMDDNWYYGLDVNNETSGYDEGAGSFPRSVRDWFGFNEEGIIWSIDQDVDPLEVSHLIGMNDEDQASFEVIADYIDSWDEAELTRIEERALNELDTVDADR